MHVVVEVRQSLRSVVVVGVLGASVSFGIALGIDALSHQARSACPFANAALPGAPCLAAWHGVDDSTTLEAGPRPLEAGTARDRFFAQIEAPNTGGRIVPAFKDGKTIGFKLFSIRPGSIWESIGLKNGDVVERIDGYEMTDPAKGLEAYTQVRNARIVTVDLLRRDQPVTLTIDTYAIDFASFEK